MIQQVRLSKDQIEIGKIYPIEVIHITGKGIICKIQDGDSDQMTTTFIHISKIANAFISDINDFVAVGDTFNAIGVSTDNGNELSLQHLNLKCKSKNIHIPHAFEKIEKPKATLDEMIESANSSFKDKHGKKGIPTTGKRRKSFKKYQFD